jgi:hypothetical protein
VTRKSTSDRFNACLRSAALADLKLTESGAPRGEKRYYLLEYPSSGSVKGPVFETTNLGSIERRITECLLDKMEIRLKANQGK